MTDEQARSIHDEECERFRVAATTQPRTIEVLTTSVKPDPRTVWAGPSTLAIGVGTDARTGDRIEYAGERRYMADLDRAIVEAGPVYVSVERWQVIKRTRAGYGLPVHRTR